MPGDDNIFLCPLCKKEVGVLAQVNKHLISVHDHPPLVGINGLTAARKVKTRKPVESSNSQAKTKFPAAITSQTGKSYYSCEICFRVFSSTYELTRHIDVKHGDTELHRPAKKQKTVHRAVPISDEEYERRFNLKPGLRIAIERLDLNVIRRKYAVKIDIPAERSNSFAKKNEELVSESISHVIQARRDVNSEHPDSSDSEEDELDTMVQQVISPPRKGATLRIKQEKTSDSNLSDEGSRAKSPQGSSVIGGDPERPLHRGDCGIMISSDTPHMHLNALGHSAGYGPHLVEERASLPAKMDVIEVDGVRIKRERVADMSSVLASTSNTTVDSACVTALAVNPEYPYLTGNKLLKSLGLHTESTPASVTTATHPSQASVVQGNSQILPKKEVHTDIATALSDSITISKSSPRVNTVIQFADVIIKTEPFDPGYDQTPQSENTSYDVIGNGNTGLDGRNDDDVRESSPLYGPDSDVDADDDYVIRAPSTSTSISGGGRGISTNDVIAPTVAHSEMTTSAAGERIITPKPQSTLYRCFQCERLFSVPDHLYRHLLADHGIEMIRPHPEAVVNAPSTCGVFSCSVCQCGFTDAKQLVEHQKTHHSDKEPVAAIHEKTDSSAELPIVDNGKCETYSNSYRCTVCSVAFVHLDSLYKHLIGHIDAHMPTCPVCGESFASKYDGAVERHLDMHKANHVVAAQSVLKYECKECSAVFKNQCDYEQHKKIHLPKGNKSPAVFVNEQSHRQPPKIHVISAQFACKYCLDVFQVKEDCEKHKKKHFPLGSVCDICKLFYTSDAELDRHDTNVEPMRCSDCDEVFHTCYSLRRHKLKHQQEQTSFQSVDPNATIVITLKRTSDGTCSASFSEVPEKETKAKDADIAQIISDDDDACDAGVDDADSVVSFDRNDSAQNYGRSSSDLSSTNTTATGGAKYVYSCQTCGKPFTYPSLLADHVARKMCVRGQWEMKDPNKPNFKCLACGLLFKYQVNLENHCRTSSCRTSRAGTCESCKRVFILNNERHSCVAVPGRQALHVCMVCGYSFEGLSMYREHIKTHEGYQPSTCPTCGKIFVNADLLQQHQITRTKAQKPQVQKTQVQKPKIQCSECHLNFADRWDLVQHMASHAPGSKPDVNRKKMEGAKNGAEAKTRAHIKTCTICKREFHDITALKNHMAKAHPGDCFYKCDLCNTSFSTKAALKQHTTSHLVKDNNVYKLRCTICGKAFNTKDHLRRHMFAHGLGEGGLTCDKCGTKCPNKSTLSRHLEQAHNNEKIRLCKICRKSFNSDNDLTFHELYCESQQIPVAPSAASAATHNHMTTASVNASPAAAKAKMKTEFCRTCGKGFTSEYLLRRHMVAHDVTEGHNGIFHCDVCKKRFGSGALLTKHLRDIHYEFYPFSCEGCGLVFKHSGRLKKHKLLCVIPVSPELDEIETKELDKVGQSNPAGESETGEMMTCEVCTMTFRIKSLFQAHVKTHTKNNYYECKNCKASYRHYYLFKAHTKRCDLVYGGKDNDVKTLHRLKNGVSPGPSVAHVIESLPLPLQPRDTLSQLGSNLSTQTFDGQMSSERSRAKASPDIELQEYLSQNDGTVYRKSDDDFHPGGDLAGSSNYIMVGGDLSSDCATDSDWSESNDFFGNRKLGIRGRNKTPRGRGRERGRGRPRGRPPLTGGAPAVKPTSGRPRGRPSGSGRGQAVKVPSGRPRGRPRGNRGGRGISRGRGAHPIGRVGGYDSEDGEIPKTLWMPSYRETEPSDSTKVTVPVVFLNDPSETPAAAEVNPLHASTVTPGVEEGEIDLAKFMAETAMELTPAPITMPTSRHTMKEHASNPSHSTESSEDGEIPREIWSQSEPTFPRLADINPLDTETSHGVEDETGSRHAESPRVAYTEGHSLPASDTVEAPGDSPDQAATCDGGGTPEASEASNMFRESLETLLKFKDAVEGGLDG